MARSTITVNTRSYEVAHGHKPRQSREYPIGSWAFQIDNTREPIFFHATYRDALQQAKALARYAITVLP